MSSLDGKPKRRRGGNFDSSRSAPRKRPPSRTRPEKRGIGELPDDRPGLAARLVAARLLAAVVETRTSLDGLTDPSHGHPQFRGLEPRDQMLVKAILSTALRFRGSIEAAISTLIERPLPKNATALRHVLHVAAAQILYLDIPDSAAVDLAVASARNDPRTVRFAGLVNAVLRRLSGTRDVSRETDDPIRDCPEWLFDRLIAQYGAERATAIAAAHRCPAPIDLCVTADVEGWARRLGGRAIGASVLRLDAVEGAIPELPGFSEGEWWVQDAAASLPVRLFGDCAGKRAVDLCAAPGGKTAQLCAAGTEVTALDISRSRLKRLATNLERLNLSAETMACDLAAFEPEAPFDLVLLDAPCSSTGTIRRHPDVAYTKDGYEIAKLAAVQARMLDQASRLLAPGGRLVFSNCSLDRAEGEDVVTAFLDAHPGFRRDPVTPAELPDFAFAVTANGDLRTTPEMMPAEAEGQKGGLDGFYAARFTRR